ncbi:MAG TPA: VOC family protein [Actinomycetota bacterium]|jgi:catechol 2,3-dioxygenase-like lactoylglutathione lyase family enzyme|nr:VOC family protein [Actinomycetota bacterium]
MLLGLRSAIYAAPDLAAAKAWWTEVLGKEPYFDQPFYVGFEVGGYELGLDPNGDPATSPLTYWGVADAEEAVASLLALGAKLHAGVREVGEGIKLGSVRDRSGSVVGVIENPHFGA